MLECCRPVSESTSSSFTSLLIPYDVFSQEKIARSLMPHEQFLVGSHFGRFFARSLGLPLLRRNPDQWKASRVREHKAAASSSNVISPSQQKQLSASAPTDAEDKRSKKRKRKETEQDDDIDKLFSGIGLYKQAQVGEQRPKTTTNVSLDATLLNAIKGAPDSQPSKKKKK